MNNDYLIEDNEIDNQTHCCVSIITPETVKASKDYDRRAFKFRGAFSNLQSANDRAKFLGEQDNGFHIYNLEIGKWIAWCDDPKLNADREYTNNQLNELIRQYYIEFEEKKNQYTERKNKLMIIEMRKQLIEQIIQFKQCEQLEARAILNLLIDNNYQNLDDVEKYKELQKEVTKEMVDELDIETIENYKNKIDGDELTSDEIYKQDMDMDNDKVANDLSNNKIDNNNVRNNKSNVSLKVLKKKKELKSLPDDQLYFCVSIITPDSVKNGTNFNVRGVKFRGVFNTKEAAIERVNYLKNVDKYFNVYIGTVCDWFEWVDDTTKAKEEHYMQDDVNKLMQTHERKQYEANMFHDYKKIQMVTEQLNKQENNSNRHVTKTVNDKKKLLSSLKDEMSDIDKQLEYYKNLINNQRNNNN
jgi:hypothetical protein